MNPRNIPRLEEAPPVPFFVAFSPREEAPAYGGLRSFAQKSARDAFDAYIAPFNHVRADGVLGHVEAIPEGAVVFKLVVELRPHIQELLAHLPEKPLEGLLEVKMQDPCFFRLMVHRADQHPEMVFADTIIFHEGSFYLENVMFRGQRRPFAA